MKDLVKLLIVAAFLLGGYITYDQWREKQECTVLAQRFAVNLNSVLDSGVIEEAKRVGNQSPMLGVADRVAQNSEVMNQLDAQCPGWRDGKYD